MGERYPFELLHGKRLIGVAHDPRIEPLRIDTLEPVHPPQEVLHADERKVRVVVSEAPQREEQQFAQLPFEGVLGVRRPMYRVDDALISPIIIFQEAASLRAEVGMKHAHPVQRHEMTSIPDAILDVVALDEKRQRQIVGL